MQAKQEAQIYDLIDTWNGGTEQPQTVFTGTHNDCFRWIIQNTPFSFAEATTRQGYVLDPKGAPVVTMTKARAEYILRNTKLGGDLRFAFKRPSDFRPTLYADGITEAEDAEIKRVWATMDGSSTYNYALTRIAKLLGSDA